MQQEPEDFYKRPVGSLLWYNNYNLASNSQTRKNNELDYFLRHERVAWRTMVQGPSARALRRLPI
jgi:hypothetical protein